MPLSQASGRVFALDRPGLGGTCEWAVVVSSCRREPMLLVRAAQVFGDCVEGLAVES
jgi:hypothetical protein